MNIIFRAPQSVNGYVSRMLNRLDDEIIIDKCVVIEQTDGKENYNSDKFIRINASVGYNDTFNRICDLEEIPAIDGSVLVKMEPYKSMALNMFGIRKYDLYTGTYFELEEEYLRNVRFWDYIIEKYDIDFAFFSVVPHLGWEYILYNLCKVKEIPILVLYPYQSGLYSMGTDIDNIGVSTRRLLCEDISLNETSLHDIVKQYIQVSSKEKSFTPINQKKSDRIEYIKSYHNKLLHPFSAKILFNDFINPHRHLSWDLKTICAIRKARSQAEDTVGIDYYNKRALSHPDYKTKYVFFALQLTPECSTMPMAGVFNNQLNSIRLLAYSLKAYNIKLYVKEHWIQTFRPKKFYDELFAIPNVTCVKAYVDSYDLMKYDIANATQTGTIISESIIKKKPVFCFVKGWWYGQKGVYYIQDKVDVDKALDEIDTLELPDNDVSKYFLALENTMIRWKLDYYEETAKFKDDDIIDDFVDLVKKYVNSDFDPHFSYYR